MNDFHEQDTWDQDEVEIVDLGAPDKGFSRYLFTLGEKWHVAVYLRVKLVMLVFVISLFLAVLQPSSSFVNNQAPSAHLPVSTNSFLHKIGSAVTLTLTSTSGQELTWLYGSSGTPLPIPSGNYGKNPREVLRFYQ